MVKVYENTDFYDCAFRIMDEDFYPWTTYPILILNVGQQY